MESQTTHLRRAPGVAERAGTAGLVIPANTSTTVAADGAAAGTGDRVPGDIVGVSCSDATSAPGRGEFYQQNSILPQ